MNTIKFSTTFLICYALAGASTTHAAINDTDRFITVCDTVMSVDSLKVNSVIQSSRSAIEKEIEASSNQLKQCESNNAIATALLAKDKWDKNDKQFVKTLVLGEISSDSLPFPLYKNEKEEGKQGKQVTAERMKEDASKGKRSYPVLQTLKHIANENKANAANTSTLLNALNSKLATLNSSDLHTAYSEATGLKTLPRKEAIHSRQINNPHYRWIGYDEAVLRSIDRDMHWQGYEWARLEPSIVVGSNVSWERYNEYDNSTAYITWNVLCYPSHPNLRVYKNVLFTENGDLLRVLFFTPSCYSIIEWEDENRKKHIDRKPLSHIYHRLWKVERQSDTSFILHFLNEQQDQITLVKLFFTQDKNRHKTEESDYENTFFSDKMVIFGSDKNIGPYGFLNENYEVVGTLPFNASTYSHEPGVASDRIPPDLVFNDLKGPVKSCTAHSIGVETDYDPFMYRYCGGIYPNTVHFDIKGKWLNPPEWNKEMLEADWFDKTLPKIKRNNRGEITYIEDFECNAPRNFVWRNGKVVNIGDLWEMAYGHKGELTKTIDCGQLEYEEECIIIFEISDYEYDTHGNWIKRKITVHNYGENIFANNSGGSNIIIQTREITYYDE